MSEDISSLSERQDSGRERKAMFEKEQAHFQAHREEWLKTVRGKFALIKGEECFGFYDTDLKAYEEGVQRFGSPPFLIKRVLEEDEKLNIPALEFGLLHAHSCVQFRVASHHSGGEAGKSVSPHQSSVDGGVYRGHYLAAEHQERARNG